MCYDRSSLWLSHSSVEHFRASNALDRNRGSSAPSRFDFGRIWFDSVGFDSIHLIDLVRFASFRLFRIPRWPRTVPSASFFLLPSLTPLAGSRAAPAFAMRCTFLPVRLPCLRLNVPFILISLN